MKNKETLEGAAKKYDGENAHSGKTSFIAGAKWDQERILAFINDEDNHTEGELGNSCIDVQTLINFIKAK